jgi:hypothetical protein
LDQLFHLTMILVYNHSMYEPRSAFRDPKKQIFIVVLLAVVLYIALLGRQGEARDILVSGDFAFVSVGRYGGLRVLDVSDHIRPREIAYVETPGDAHALTMVGSYIFLADGRRGLRVIDVADPSMPVVIGALQTEGTPLDIAIGGGYAYVANGETGLSIIDITNPTRPYVVSRIDTPGFAQGVALVDANALQPGGAVGGEPRITHVYVADGRSGVQIIDVRLPIAPGLVAYYDPPGEVRGVSISGPVAVVAAGDGGLRLLDITNPGVPLDFSAVDTPGHAWSTSIHGANVFVADGDQGVLLFDFSNPTQPRRIFRVETNGPVSRIWTDGSRVFTAEGVHGVRIFETFQPFEPGRTGYYDTPGEASFVQVARGLFSLVRGRLGDVPVKVWGTLRLVFFDLILLGVVLVFWLVFFSQFVLPVRTLTERWQAATRIFDYHLGRHGAAIFIENGRIQQAARDKRRKGSGVALLDTASATVLRNAHAFTRPVGPGIVFIEENEYPEGAVSLHRHFESLGPRPEGDPYQPQRAGEAPEEYDERQKRRYQTSGLTRDGVEVVPNISVSFGLDSEPGSGRSQFGFNPVAVWKAIAREGVNPDALPDSDRRHVAWKWLPVYIAVDLWREYLRKFQLDELFTLSPDWHVPGDSRNGRATAFDVINRKMIERMTTPEVVELDELGSPIAGRKKRSLEFDILKERGLRVYGVSVHSLRFPPFVEEQLVEHWKGTWLERAQSERNGVERLHSIHKMEGQELALKTFAASVSQSLVNQAKDNPHMGVGDGLEAAVHGTFRMATREPNFFPRITNQVQGLREIIEWIRKSPDD